MLWLIVIELILFCALFTLMVKIAVGNNALNGLYFYPEPLQERAFAIGLTDRDTVAQKTGCQRAWSVDFLEGQLPHWLSH